MSDPRNNEERRMLDRLIELEAEKNRGYAEDKLSAAGMAALLRRLRASGNAKLGGEAYQAPARKTQSWRVWAPVAIAALLLVAFGLGRLFDHIQRTAVGRLEERLAPQVALSNGDVMQASRGGITRAKAGSRLAPGAGLSTGQQGSSVATWQAADGISAITATLGKKTAIDPIEASFSDNRLHLRIEQREGTVAYAVNKNRATLHIVTPAANVEVVGTKFIVRVTSAGTTIQVAEGSVDVRPGAEGAKNAPAQRVSAQQKVLALPGRIIPSVLPQDAIDKNLQSAFDKLTSLTEIPEAQRDRLYKAVSKELFDIEDKAQNIGDKKSGKIVSKGSPRKGKLSRVTTVSGKSYVGFYSHRGDYIEIATSEGNVKIPVGDIQEVRDAD